MTNKEAIEILKQFKKCLSDVVFDEKGSEAWQMAIQALSQVSEIEENIIKYMKKYPNHVGNTDFWEGFYACRNVVLQLDDEEYAPKEQEPCDDAISREAALEKMADYVASGYADSAEDFEEYSRIICQLPSVTQKSGKWIPFSERLPKPFEHCLITTTDGEVIYHYDDGHYSKYKAWMPLPEPYKAESEE